MFGLGRLIGWLASRLNGWFIWLVDLLVGELVGSVDGWVGVWVVLLCEGVRRGGRSEGRQ